MHSMAETSLIATDPYPYQDISLFETSPQQPGTQPD